jgi:hypothetical protein
MTWFQYAAPGLDSGHWGLPAGIAVVLAFMAWTAWRDLKRPDRVPDDAGPDPRLGLFRRTTLHLWAAAVATTGFWLAAGGTWTGLGFRLDRGLGLWVGGGIALLGCVLLAVQLRHVQTSESARVELAEQLDRSKGYDWLRPTTPREYGAFRILAVTAGITEEVVFRGFLIGALAVWLPVWAAAVVALALFVGAHVYQGLTGMVRILPASTVLTLIFLLSGSLWPGIVLHTVVDVAGGEMMWILRNRRRSGAAAAEATA